MIQSGARERNQSREEGVRASLSSILLACYSRSCRARVTRVLIARLCSRRAPGTQAMSSVAVGKNLVASNAKFYCSFT